MKYATVAKPKLFQQQNTTREENPTHPGRWEPFPDEEATGRKGIYGSIGGRCARLPDYPLGLLIFFSLPF